MIYYIDIFQHLKDRQIMISFDLNFIKLKFNLSAMGNMIKLFTFCSDLYRKEMINIEVWNENHPIMGHFSFCLYFEYVRNSIEFHLSIKYIFINSRIIV